MEVPFVSLEATHTPIRMEMVKAFESFYDSSQYVLGEQVKSFESAYSTFNEVKYCVGTSNGLDALHIALKTLGIGNGDEVIVPANTFIATLLAISFVGAVPVLVEPNPNTYNICPMNIRKAITAKTRVIIPVHLFGQACEMDEIERIAAEYGLYIVEDNAQSQGAEYNGRKTGSWGHINATSFYPGKNLGALGDAGAITTDKSELADFARSLRNYGSTKKYHNNVVGFNMRLDECQAALLNVKLKYLPSWTAQRQEIAGWYFEELQGVANLILPQIHENATHVFHLFVIRSNRRDELQQYLALQGIGSLVHYPIPPHLQKAYKHLNYSRGDFPIAEELADSSLSLPLWPGMTQNMVAYISDKIKTFV